jgi:hypothetical protein
MQVADIVRRLGELRELLEAVNKELTKLKSEKNALHEKLIRMLEELDVERLTTGGYTVSITQNTLPTVTDWDEFYQFIRENNALHLLERRPLASAYRETLELRDGEPIPGVKSFVQKSISMRST